MAVRSLEKLTRYFYARPTLEVCPDLLGRHLVYESPEGQLSARIVEVEAYIGTGDPACHAAAGRTNRTEIMFGAPGHAYIYFVYGMYHCLNFVTEPEGTAAAVLLRAAEPLGGASIMRSHSPRITKDSQLLSGPGRLCRAFGLTRDQNGLDLTASELYIVQGDRPVKDARRSPRVGVNRGARRAWRFFDAESEAVSARRNSKTE
jgi:DNA-3-methyladenine glycosylase